MNERKGKERLLFKVKKKKSLLRYLGRARITFANWDNINLRF